MTRALQEPSGLPGNVEKDRRSEPPGFLTDGDSYRMREARARKGTTLNKT